MNIVSKIAWSILGIVAIVMILSMFYPQYQEFMNLQKHLEALETEHQFQGEQLQRLKQNQEQMRTDSVFVEQVAREEIGFAKPGETIVKFMEDRRADHTVHEN